MRRYRPSSLTPLFQRPPFLLHLLYPPNTRPLSSSPRSVLPSPSSPSLSPSPSPSPPSNWLTPLKTRLGALLNNPLSPPRTSEAGRILRVLAREWRELVAGREGFLVGSGRAGVEGQAVAWGDMVGFYDHVNNVAYVRYAESARVNWIRNYAVHIDPTHKKEWSDMVTSKSEGLILRSIRTDYKFPMTWPDRISVYHKLRSAPTASMDFFILDVLILSERHQRAAARCEEDIVIYDYRQGRKTPLKGFMVNAFQDTWAAQEEAKAKNETRLRKLLARVEGLEKES